MNISWKKINNRAAAKDELPKDKPFLGLWKGVVCLCEYDEEVRRFYIGMMPASYLGFWALDPEREGKFTHWAYIDIPEDY